MVRPHDGGRQTAELAMQSAMHVVFTSGLASRQVVFLSRRIRPIQPEGQDWQQVVLWHGFDDGGEEDEGLWHGGGPTT